MSFWDYLSKYITFYITNCVLCFYNCKSCDIKQGFLILPFCNRMKNNMACFLLKVNSEGTLYIRDIQHTDSGNYTCLVENTHGRDSIVYSVYVRGKTLRLYDKLISTFTFNLNFLQLYARINVCFILRDFTGPLNGIIRDWQLQN